VADKEIVAATDEGMDGKVKRSKRVNVEDTKLEKVKKLVVLRKNFVRGEIPVT
jgi:hypothetical protein